MVKYIDINYYNKYAYAEVWAILNWLGDDYKRKVPKNLLRLFKDERKFGYDPQIDFSKELGPQVRQETKNIIAYLNYSCWIENDSKKRLLKKAVEENHQIRKEKERIQKEKEKALRRKNGNISVNAQIDAALKNLK